MVAIKDAAGNNINTYDYDIWGNVLSKTEGMNNPYRYTGEPQDDESGLIYLRARYYDPTIGRFISQDTVEGDLNNPLSLNLYTYVQNNPLRYTDPSGHSPEWLSCDRFCMQAYVYAIYFKGLAALTNAWFDMSPLSTGTKAAIGMDYVTGETLSTTDRVIFGVSAAAQVAGAGSLSKTVSSGFKLYRKMGVEEATKTLDEVILQPAKQGANPTKWTSESLGKVKEFTNKISENVDQVIVEFELNGDYAKSLMGRAVPQAGSKGNPAPRYHFEGLDPEGNYRNYGITPEELADFNKNVTAVKVIDATKK